MTPEFRDFIRLAVAGDVEELSRRLALNPGLATMASDAGATRQDPATYFYDGISHYLYEGDTAVHMASAACRPRVVERLLAHGAKGRARNRRGAEPLHYAADGRRDPAERAETIARLLAAGAEPNVRDRSGVTPLHRAVRSRSLAAVRALLDGGADARGRNGSGSTPLHLAVQATGQSGSGDAEAHEQQTAIVGLLLARGAQVSDRDGAGRDVLQATRSESIRQMLRGAAAR